MSFLHVLLSLVSGSGGGGEFIYPLTSKCQLELWKGNTDFMALVGVKRIYGKDGKKALKNGKNEVERKTKRDHLGINSITFNHAGGCEGKKKSFFFK